MCDRAGFAKKRFLNLLENLVIIFSEFGLSIMFILIAVFLHKSHSWKKSGT